MSLLFHTTLFRHGPALDAGRHAPGLPTLEAYITPPHIRTKSLVCRGRLARAGKAGQP
jgi:hypothetical protein